MRLTLSDAEAIELRVMLPFLVKSLQDMGKLKNARLLLGIVKKLRLGWADTGTLELHREALEALLAITELAGQKP